MNHSEQLLEYIYQNVKMGSHAIEELSGNVRDEKFHRHIDAQRREYDTFAASAASYLKNFDMVPREKGMLSKAGLAMGVRMNLMKDDSTSHLAEMMIQGSSMGIVDLTKKTREFSDAEPAVMDLAQKIIEFEQNNIERLKGFLGQES